MEGPSIHLLAQELHNMVGQKIIDSYGNASFEKDELKKQIIKEIYGFGKRLIIQLDTHALAIHFLMFGSYRLNEQRKEFTPRLAIITKKHSLFFYNCSIKLIKKNNLKKLLPLEYDILSSEWNLLKVVRTIKKHPKETIDDVLLNQDIFAGVGNIIKNEVLFLSHVSPLTKVSKLSSKKIKEIALNAREFSHKFLELRKIFQLKKHLQIYRKKNCPVCMGLVIRKKTGKRNRWSFYCPQCQK